MSGDEREAWLQENPEVDLMVTFSLTEKEIREQAEKMREGFEAGNE